VSQKCRLSLLLYFFNNYVKHQLILLTLVFDILNKLYTETYKLAHLTYKLLPHYLAKCFFNNLIKRPTSQKFPNTPTIFIFLIKTLKMSLQSVFKAQTEPSSLYMPLLNQLIPQYAAGMQFTSETHAAVTLAE